MNAEILTSNSATKFLKYLTSEISENQNTLFGQIQNPFHTFAILLVIYTHNLIYRTHEIMKRKDRFVLQN